jgi:hypothetical protein
VAPSKSMTNPPQVLRNAQLDALKGVLLLIMSVNHLSDQFPGLAPGIGRFYWTFGIFSVALGFVFISGITTVLSLDPGAPYIDTVKKLLLRVRTIYVAHVISATVAVVSVVVMPETSNQIEKFRRIWEAPITSWLEIVTFLYCPLLLDIIPLYCFLFFATVLILPLLKTANRRLLLLFLSCVLWVLARHWNPTLGLYTSNFLIFHPLAWQLLFVVGMLVGVSKGDAHRVLDQNSGLQRVWASPLVSRSLLCICLATTIFFFNQRHRVIPSLRVPWSTLNSIMGIRATLSPGSLINLGALSYLLWRLHSTGFFSWEICRAPLHLLAWIGRRSLLVFTWNISVYYVLVGVGFNVRALSPLQQGLILGFFVSSCCIPLSLLPLGKRLASRLRIGGVELLLCMMCAAIPIAYLPNFGVPYREIKNVMLWGGAASIALLSIKRFMDSPGRSFERLLSLPLYSVFGVLLLQILSLVYSPNLGEGLTQIFTLTSAVVLIWGTSRSSLTVERVAVWLLIPGLVTTALIFYRSYFGGTLTPAGAGLGTLVGERNSSGILLAQIVPLLLVFSCYKSPLGEEVQKKYAAVKNFAAALLIAVSVLAAVLPRSRTAWGMLAFFLLSFLFFSVRTHSRVWRGYVVTGTLSLLSTVLLLTLLPTQLRWSSETPYLESATSLRNPIQNSNGRDQLWLVGAEMLESHPLLGVGAGNYSVVMKEYLVPSGANPQSFAFLRNDLPLFNDYLQAGVELGYGGGFLYLLFFLGTPVSLLWQQMKGGVTANRESAEKEKGAEKNIHGILASLSCLGIALAGFVDYPFHRAENVTLYSVLVGLSIQRLAKSRSEHHLQPHLHLTLLLRRCIFSFVGLCLCIGTLCYGLSFGLRTVGYRNVDLKPLTLSWRLWPWDTSWDERYGGILRKKGNEQALTDYVSKRLSYWPFASTTWITLAESAEANGAHSVAANAYTRALFEVPGGRCNYRAKIYLERYLRHPSLPSDVANSLQLQLKRCTPH